MAEPEFDSIPKITVPERYKDKDPKITATIVKGQHTLYITTQPFQQEATYLKTIQEIAYDKIMFMYQGISIEGAQKIESKLKELDQKENPFEDYSKKVLENILND